MATSDTPIEREWLHRLKPGTLLNLKWTVPTSLAMVITSRVTMYPGMWLQVYVLALKDDHIVTIDLEGKHFNDTWEVTSAEQ